MLPDEAGIELRRRGARSDVIVPLVGASGQVGALLLAESTEPDPLGAEETVELAEIGRGLTALAERAIRHEQAAERRAYEQVSAAIADPASVRIAFQPIVSLRGRAVAGYEALARFAADVPPAGLFAAAARAGLDGELEAMAIRRARAEADTARLPAGSFLAVNVSPSLLTHPAVAASLAGDLGRVVIELTENERVLDYPSLNAALAGYRARGARIAVDDAGAGYASMRHVTELRPDLVKLDAGLIRGLHDSATQQAFLRAASAFVAEIGATVVAEGVEDPEDLAIIASSDVPILVQGFAIADPGPPWPAPSFPLEPAPPVPLDASPEAVVAATPRTRRRRARPVAAVEAAGGNP
jgi:EAL domain-containing protein (putative c-di-GMP-specific phosphodiesterase class I)